MNETRSGTAPSQSSGQVQSNITFAPKCHFLSFLGDLVISVETAKRQSNRFGLDDMGMVILLMVHGVLHLIGYEHEGTKKGAREMTLKQKQLLHQVMKTGILE